MKSIVKAALRSNDLKSSLENMRKTVCYLRSKVSVIFLISFTTVLGEKSFFYEYGEKYVSLREN